VAKRKDDPYAPDAVWYKVKNLAYTQAEDRWESRVLKGEEQGQHRAQRSRITVSQAFLLHTEEERVMGVQENIELLLDVFSAIERGSSEGRRGPELHAQRKLKGLLRFLLQFRGGFQPDRVCSVPGEVRHFWGKQGRGPDSETPAPSFASRGSPVRSRSAPFLSSRLAREDHCLTAERGHRWVFPGRLATSPLVPARRVESSRSESHRRAVVEGLEGAEQ
jgi:hypothetical protein